MLLRLFRALLPKEEKFVEHFHEHARHIVEAAEALRDIIAGTADFESAFRKIREQEGLADAVTRTTLEAIHRTFITPFDRSDIHGLITQLDDIIDLIEEVAQRIAIYGITDFTPEMLKLADTLRECAVLLYRAMPQLGAITRNAAALQNLGQQISMLEGQGDATLRQGLGLLMKGGGDPIAVIERKEIYELLENAIDRCQDVADVILGIVIEHV